MNRALLLFGCVSLTLISALPVAAQDAVPAPVPASATCKIPVEVKPFMDRVFARMALVDEKPYDFEAWPQAGRPTEEGFGLLTPDAAVDAEKVVRRVMDVNRYVANLKYVTSSRSVADARFVPPNAVRFYEMVDPPGVSPIHFEAVLTDAGTCNGFRVVTWHMLEAETNALSHDGVMRSDYNEGAWLASSTSIGYALSSAPVKDDAGTLDWFGVTTGADATARMAFKGNLEGMITWASKP